MNSSVLKTKNNDQASTHQLQQASPSFQVNTVVAKGNIRVSPRRKLQVVASSETPESTDESLSHKVETIPPAVSPRVEEPSEAISWAPVEKNAIEDQQLEQIQTSNGSPMKLIKLIAAAAALGVTAIALAFLQFSDADEAAHTAENTAAPLNPVVTAAVASTPTGPTAASGVLDSDGNDLVAQITAGTLAALRKNAESAKAQATLASAEPTTTGGSTSKNALYNMVLQAIEQGQSVQYIDRMVNEAHQNKSVTVPALLLTDNNRVDTQALLTLFTGQ